MFGILHNGQAHLGLSSEKAGRHSSLAAIKAKGQNCHQRHDAKSSLNVSADQRLVPQSASLDITHEHCAIRWETRIVTPAKSNFEANTSHHSMLLFGTICKHTCAYAAAVKSCRIIFTVECSSPGLRPELASFLLTPHLNQDWKLSGVHLHVSLIDLCATLEVSRP